MQRHPYGPPPAGGGYQQSGSSPNGYFGPPQPPKKGMSTRQVIVLVVGCTFGLLVLVGVAGVLAGLSSAASAPTPATTTPRTEAPPPYSLPDSITLDAVLERGASGEIYLSGTTNLPDGFKLGAEVPAGGGQDFNIFVHQGAFRSAGFTSPKGPLPAGRHKVAIFSYFNQFWQTPTVLEIVGTGGAKLKGSIIKPADPSDKNAFGDVNTVRADRVLQFPPLR